MQTIHNRPLTCRLPSSLAAFLPPHLTDAILTCGAPDAEEIRLHALRVATVTYRGKSYSTGVTLSEKELSDVLKRMCAGSLYAFSHSINEGFLTVGNGIRVGVCGVAAVESGSIIGVSSVSGLMIRIPHTVNLSPTPVLDCFHKSGWTKGILVYAPPGHGKTTLLRAVARTLATPPNARRTVAVDTRAELHFGLDDPHLDLDILIGYPRDKGIEIAVRSMGAEVILCDEISNARDAHAILGAASCGVPLIASAHAASVEELLTRPFMQSLHHAHVFSNYVGIRRDGSTGLSYRVTDWQAANEAVRI